MSELDTSNWKSYPFTVNGIEYVSKVKPESDMENRVNSVPQTVFLQINESCVRELIGNISDRNELLAKLEEINENAREAVIELV